MAKPFDATTKQLVEGHPADWLAYAGLSTGQSIEVVDADLSSFTVAADKVIRVGGPNPYIAHFEFQSGIDSELDRRILLYNVLLRWRHGLPVRSVAILLRPEAASPAVTGRVTDIDELGNRLDFAYKLIKVWEQPPELFLQAGIGTLPLAPISAVRQDSLDSVLDQMLRRLQTEAPAEARELEAAAYILMGLRYPRQLIARILKGARAMKESVTYQLILEEGEARGAADGERKALLKVGEQKFGAPDARIVSKLQAITATADLERLIDRLHLSTSWDDLLAGT